MQLIVFWFAGLGNVFDVSTPPPPPPPPAVSVWGESRATFSDVVARSDSYSSVVAPRHNSDSNLLSYSTSCTVPQPTLSSVTSASAASSGSASLGKYNQNYNVISVSISVIDASLPEQSLVF